MTKTEKLIETIKIKVERIPRKRGFKLSVLPNSTVLLKCGFSSSPGHIRKFALEHQNWIEASVGKSSEIQNKYPPKSFKEGEAFPILGEDYFLKFQSAPNGKAQRKISVELKFPQILVHIPASDFHTDFSRYPHPKIKKSILEFYFQIAERVLVGRINVLAGQMGLKPSRVSLRKQKTLWGSCSPRGSIQLNWKLSAAPLNVIDYVIIHELAHMRHPNHSAVFWSEVEKFCPEYKQARQWLRKNYFAFDFFHEISELHASILSK